MPPSFPASDRSALLARSARAPAGLSCPEDLRGAWVFGAGSMGCFMVDYLRDNGSEAAGFLDNGAVGPGREVLGLPVVAPGSGRVPRDAWIIIAVKDAAAEVEAQCRAGGFTKLVRGWQLVHAWAGSTRVPAYVSSAQGFLDLWERYEDIVPLLADPLSRRVLERAIRYQITCQDEDLPPFDPDEYFRPSFRPDQVYAEVVDCGAYDGDTLRALQARHPGCFGAYHGFEPDPATFGRFLDCVATLPPDMAARVHGHPWATGARAGRVKFGAGCGLGSSMRTDGEVDVPVVALDHVLRDAFPTFLKMDIEGAEIEALEGAEAMIRRCRPTLAICVYHRPEHYRTIPLWIHALDLEYRLELRHHSRYFTGTVCYAIPPSP